MGLFQKSLTGTENFFLLISKYLFGVFNFFQKMNKNKSHSSKIEFVWSFFGGNVCLQKSFRFCLTFGPSKLSWCICELFELYLKQQKISITRQSPCSLKKSCEIYSFLRWIDEGSSTYPLVEIDGLWKMRRIISKSNWTLYEVAWWKSEVLYEYLLEFF